jgi:hypothetical protein
MIWPTDALLLAGTKLKTRKIRLSITIVISSLLFAGLVFLASVFDGTVHSLQSFGKEGYGGRYLVQANPITTFPFDDETLTTELSAQNKALIDQKKALAKKLGLEYNEKSDMSLPLITQPGGPGGKEIAYPNTNSPIVVQRMREKNEALPGITFDAFTKNAMNSGGTATYLGAPGANMMGPSFAANSGQYAVLVGGKEDFSNTKSNPFGGGGGEPRGVETLTTVGWSSIDAKLMARMAACR